MLRAFLLLFSPGVFWMHIVNSKPGFWMNILRCGLPLTLMTYIAESYAIDHWLKQNRFFLRMVSSNDVFRSQIIHGLTTLVLLAFLALIIKWICDSFNFRPPFNACSTLAIYGFSPVLFARFINCIPEINPWISVGLGITGCSIVLYQGVGIVLQPDQTKGFGLYILFSIVFAFITIIMKLFELMLLEGKI